MMLVYICAGTGVMMILIAIVIMVAPMRIKSPADTLLIWYDDLKSVTWGMLIVGCILLELSAAYEAYMLGGRV